MNVTKDPLADKSLREIVEQAEAVQRFVVEALGSGAKACEAFTRTRLLTILRGGAKSVIRGLRRQSTARDLHGDARRQITKIVNYLAAHLPRLRYDVYLAAGYPIATGVIEERVGTW